MRESKFTARNRTCRRAIQVLQFVVLNGAIRITIVVMMAMPSVSSDGRLVKNQLTFGHMLGVLAQ